MERRKHRKGLDTFLEHWGMGTLPVLPISLVVSQIFSFFTNLHGRPWICFSIASMALLLLGASLILYAKLPVYGSGRFFYLWHQIDPRAFSRILSMGLARFLVRRGFVVVLVVVEAMR